MSYSAACVVQADEQVSGPPPKRGDARIEKAESITAHNSAMLDQSFDDQVAADTVVMNAAQTAKAAAEAGKANVDGDLAATSSTLKAVEEKLATANTDELSQCRNEVANCLGGDEGNGLQARPLLRVC